MKRIMILGAGRLGNSTLISLGMMHPNLNFHIVSRTAEILEKQVNLARAVLAKWQIYPKITTSLCNILETEVLSNIIQKWKPDILFNATTPFPWWKIHNLPTSLSNLANKTGPGIWAPLDCLLPHRIAKALEDAHSKSIYVNGCYPDLTNAFLRNMTNAPLVGIGNLANSIPSFKHAFAIRDSVLIEDVSIRLIAHHFTSLNATSKGKTLGAPYLLNVQTPVTDEVIESKNWPLKILTETAPRTRGEEGQSVTTASAASLLSNLITGEQINTHAPGPLGLVGGYPIQINSDRTIILDIDNFTTKNKAIKINEVAQTFDGIANVQERTITISNEASSTLEIITGIQLEKFSINELEEISRDIINQLNLKYDLCLEKI